MIGMRATRRIWIAFFAIYALVVQSLAGAHTTGVRAATWQLDFAGLIICVDHGVDTLPPGDTPFDTNRMPDCCLPGCAMFAPALAFPPDILNVVPAPTSMEAVPLPVAREWTARPRQRFPVNPRAPPVLFVQSGEL